VPTDAGFRYFVDRLLPATTPGRGVELDLVRREVDEAMRVTTETLSQVTNLLAIVSAPPVDTATIRHVEVLGLQPQVVMTVVITSTGGVSKRMSTFPAPVDPGLVKWAGEYLNERLVGHGLGSRMLHTRLLEPGLTATEEAFLTELAPALTELADTAHDTLYVEGAARLLREHRFQDLSQINELMQMLEERMALLGLLRTALGSRDVLVRIGAENEAPALRSLALVAANYGLPQRALGTVSLIGPVRMDYGQAIGTVREAARQLSRFIADVYDEG
jgi:heat-inducible transcriptional repressor